MYRQRLLSIILLRSLLIMALLSGIHDEHGHQVMAQDKQCFYFYYDPGITTDDLEDTVSVESHFLGSEIALNNFFTQAM